MTIRENKDFYGRDGFVVCSGSASIRVRTRRTAELIADVLRTRSDHEERSRLIDGYIKNEAENTIGWAGWVRP